MGLELLNKITTRSSVNGTPTTPPKPTSHKGFDPNPRQSNGYGKLWHYDCGQSALVLISEYEAEVLTFRYAREF
jgi:hypothetical protein